MFEIRAICDPADTERVAHTLSRAFRTSGTQSYPSRTSEKELLYLTAEHRPAEVTLFSHVRAVTAWLDAHNGTGEDETAARLLKVGEELGEAVQAYLGTTGQNPRKGITHTLADVAAELCDVILAAAVSLGNFTDDPAHTLNTVVRTRSDRLKTLRAADRPARVS
ncbi:MazG-like family protein [Streptomyces rimosus]|uniref:MazG-like family protein n=1 Tax=Streptomyces rimosus TaxID=1927 RepID=UPI0037D30164